MIHTKAFLNSVFLMIALNWILVTQIQGLMMILTLNPKKKLVLPLVWIILVSLDMNSQLIYFLKSQVV